MRCPDKSIAHLAVSLVGSLVSVHEQLEAAAPGTADKIITFLNRTLWEALPTRSSRPSAGELVPDVLLCLRDWLLATTHSTASANVQVSLELIEHAKVGWSTHPPPAGLTTTTYPTSSSDTLASMHIDELHSVLQTLHLAPQSRPISAPHAPLEPSTVQLAAVAAVKNASYDKKAKKSLQAEAAASANTPGFGASAVQFRIIQDTGELVSAHFTHYLRGFPGPGGPACVGAVFAESEGVEHSLSATLWKTLQDPCVQLFAYGDNKLVSVVERTDSVKVVLRDIVDRHVWTYKEMPSQSEDTRAAAVLPVLHQQNQHAAAACRDISEEDGAPQHRVASILPSVSETETETEPAKALPVHEADNVIDSPGTGDVTSYLEVQSTAVQDDGAGAMIIAGESTITRGSSESSLSNSERSRGNTEDGAGPAVITKTEANRQAKDDVLPESCSAGSEFALQSLLAFLDTDDATGLPLSAPSEPGAADTAPDRAFHAASASSTTTDTDMKGTRGAPSPDSNADHPPAASHTHAPRISSQRLVPLLAVADQDMPEHPTPASNARVRRLLFQLGLASWGAARRTLVPVAKTEKSARALWHLDTKVPSREQHKVGVVYIGPTQIASEDILSSTSSSVAFEEFVDELGWPVALKSHRGYTGKLKDSQFPGLTLPYYSTPAMEVIFHVHTRMLDPTPNPTPEEALLVANQRWKHIGNDAVNIVWLEDYHQDYSTLQLKASRLVDLSIVIFPQPTGMFRVQLVRAKANSVTGAPLFDGAILSRAGLAAVVRASAINAGRALRRGFEVRVLFPCNRCAHACGIVFLCQRRHLLSVSTASVCPLR